jgi:hypothetical protein
VTFELFRTIKTPFISGALAVFDRLVDWLLDNSRRPEPVEESFGPNEGLPIGPGAGLTGQVFSREAGFQADGDGFNFDGQWPNAFDTGWVQVGGLGIIPIGRLVLIGEDNTAGPEDGPAGDLQTGFTGRRFRWFRPDGSEGGEIPSGSQINRIDAQTGSWRLFGTRITLSIRDLDGNNTPIPDPFPRPAPAPTDLPDVQPLRQAPPAAPPAPAAPPVAPPLPAEPAPVPVEQPTRRPGEQPARRPVTPSTAPASPARLAPRSPGGALAVTPDAGAVQAPAPRPVPTPPNREFLRGQVPIPNSNPRPTPDGIAQEAGRLEGKLALLLEREQGGPGGGAELLPLLEEIRAALEELRSRLLAPGGGGSYQLNPSCTGPDGASSESPVVVDIAPSDNAVADVAARVDALAVLLQGHKDLGQPTCRGPNRASNVTVQFEGI